jgi:para-nitrobenzyl esterase
MMAEGRSANMGTNSGTTIEALRPALTGLAILGALSAVVTITTSAIPPKDELRVATKAGVLEGSLSADGKVRTFKGVPYAAPPVGDLRWKEPQPVPAWQGVRKATEFGPRCMQGRIYDDMVFRDAGPSEDCLHLNVWSPKTSGDKKLPVMVWIYGGGFQAGATSEPRQDGERLAHRGVVVVSMDYRLGIFGFYSHPELTAESPHHASGNYGLLDQAAAIQWVHDNIAAFGGDPQNVTIFGESAGSFSVSAQMASPLAKDLIHKAIGESGAAFGATLKTKAVAEGENRDAIFGQELGMHSLRELRGVAAQDLLNAVLKGQDIHRFGPNVDGYFLPLSVSEIYEKRQQAQIPLLAGWNRDEENYHAFFDKENATKENYQAGLRRNFGEAAPEAAKLFPYDTDERMKDSAGFLSGAQFIAYGTWRWIEMQRESGAAPVYRYQFDQAPPGGDGSDGPNVGVFAYHSAEIEFVFGTLDSKKISWRPEDYKTSEQISEYWTNFAKHGNPNGSGLAEWPKYDDKSGFQVMHLAAKPNAVPDDRRAQFQFLEKHPNFAE